MCSLAAGVLFLPVHSSLLPAQSLSSRIRISRMRVDVESPSTWSHNVAHRCVIMISYLYSHTFIILYP